MTDMSNNSDSLTVEFNFYATYARYCRSDLMDQTTVCATTPVEARRLSRQF
jgi:hypothetical protein